MGNQWSSDNQKKRQREGSQFEHIFQKLAVMSGFVVEDLPAAGSRKIGIRWIHCGMFCDYILAGDGVGFFDVKSFEKGYVGHADLELHKPTKRKALEKLAAFHDRGHPAGWIVWHRRDNQVVFYPATMLIQLHPKTSVAPRNALFLGGLETMNLKKIWENNTTDELTV